MFYVHCLSSRSILNRRLKIPSLCYGYVCTYVSNNIMVVQIVDTSQELFTRMETSLISAGDLDLVLWAQGNWAVRFFKSSIHRIWLNIGWIINLTRGFAVFFSCCLIRMISRLVRQARSLGSFSIPGLHRVYTDEKYSILMYNCLTVALYMLINVQCDMYLL